MVIQLIKTKPKLDLEKLKNNQNQHVKVDLHKVNIRTLASQVDVLSEDVKLYMKLLTSNIYYALNDRTVNLLMKGDIDMSATASGTSGGEPGFSDGEIREKLEQEKC